MELTPMQIEAALRQCAYSVECTGCPYESINQLPAGDCIKTLMGDAAEALATIQGEQ